MSERGVLPPQELSREPAVARESLRLYVAETEPSGIEKRKLIRWFLLALAAFLLHLFFFWVVPRLSPPVPPPPIEVTQIDPRKLEAVKNKWKERGFLLSKDEKAPKDKTPEPKDARYESDRNRVVEKETRARQTNVVPRQGGAADGKDARTRTAPKKTETARTLPLSQLSNFRSLPRPGPRADEQDASRARGSAGPSGDQAIDDPNLPVGAENMLNTVESVYYSFYARIFDQIGPLWQSRVREVLRTAKLHSGTYTTRADVVFDAEGNYVGTNILESSGHGFLDEAVLWSWARIPRFPNPPRGLVQPDGKIHMGWGFSVHIDRNLNWQYVPPDRVY